MQIIKLTLVLLLLPLLLRPAYALTEGVDYYLASNPTPLSSGAVEQVEVTYFFNFSCPACNAFEGPLITWLDDKPDYVNFSEVPVPWERSQYLYAKTFYVLEAFNRTDLQLPLFRAIHKERKLLNSASRIAGWMGEQGMDEDTAEAAFESFSVQTKVKRALRTISKNGVDSTPQLLIAGRYRLSPSLSGTYEQLLATADELIESIKTGNPPQ